MPQGSEEKGGYQGTNWNLYIVICPFNVFLRDLCHLVVAIMVQENAVQKKFCTGLSNHAFAVKKKKKHKF